MLISLIQYSDSCITAAKNRPIQTTALAVSTVLGTYGLYCFAPHPLLLAAGASALTLTAGKIAYEIFNAPPATDSLDEIIQDCDKAFDALGKTIESIENSHQNKSRRASPPTNK